MIEEIVAFFRKQRNADMVFFHVQGDWCPPWTLLAHNVGGAHRIVQQANAMGASGFRYCSAAELRLGSWRQEIVIVTDFPSFRQEVCSLSSGKVKDLGKFVETPVIAALRQFVEGDEVSQTDVELVFSQKGLF